MERISTQGLNAIFDCFNEQADTVLWVHSQDYQRQIYLSRSFEPIWGVKTDNLYNNPSNWGDFIHANDREKVNKHLESRLSHPDKLDKDVLLYRILDQNNDTKFIRSSAFLLTSDNIDFAYFGISKLVSQREWEYESEKLNRTHDQNDQMKNYLFQILKNELRLQPKSETPNNSLMPTSNSQDKIIVMDKGRQIQLTQRELDCVYHLMQGKSAKQTANIMNVSARTVEFHLGNVKEKVNCRTKIELLSKIVVQNSK